MGALGQELRQRLGETWQSGPNNHKRKKKKKNWGRGKDSKEPAGPAAAVHLPVLMLLCLASLSTSATNPTDRTRTKKKKENKKHTCLARQEGLCVLLQIVLFCLHALDRPHFFPLFLSSFSCFCFVCIFLSSSSFFLLASTVEKQSKAKQSKAKQSKGLRNQF